MRIGAHVSTDNPLAEAAALDADVIQIFLTNPQSWTQPPTRDDAKIIKSSNIEFFVHTPYLINVATSNNRVRIPSRNLLRSYATAAADIGAKGLIVHGGYVTKGEDITTGFNNWRKTFEYAHDFGGFATPILIENTAGGDYACARHLETLSHLWDTIGEFDVGFCLDTCHAHCGGEDLSNIVERVKAITGKIDLIHANNSRDNFNSGRDRHANLTTGQINPELIVEIIKKAKAPVIVETPNGIAGQATDIKYLRQWVHGK